MKKQWQHFLRKNQTLWSYGIVPNLAQRLDRAMQTNDQTEIDKTLESLVRQGVMLDENGDLCFVTE